MFGNFEFARHVGSNRGLKDLIRQYTTTVSRLRLAQRNYWRSRAKVKEYASMVTAATLSLPNFLADPRETRGRERALRGLKNDMYKKTVRHSGYVSRYEDLQKTERTIRSQISMECITTDDWVLWSVAVNSAREVIDNAPVVVSDTCPNEGSTNGTTHRLGDFINAYLPSEEIGYTALSRDNELVDSNSVSDLIDKELRWR